jgi:uncharacterized protein with PQ loop repeat
MNIGWLAAIFSITAETIMGSGIGKHYVTAAYILFSIGNILWMSYSFRGDRPLFFLNTVYFLLAIRIIIIYNL